MRSPVGKNEKRHRLAEVAACFDPERVQRIRITAAIDKIYTHPFIKRLALTDISIQSNEQTADIKFSYSLQQEKN